MITKCETHYNEKLQTFAPNVGETNNPVKHAQTGSADPHRRKRNFGPSGVHALPLAPGINEGGHYFRYY